MNTAVVLGTSNSDGNTRSIVDAFIAESGAQLFDLSTYQISFFDYQHNNQQDDFLPLINELVGFKHIVFASPVYWYAMSAQLKVFFDRLSDLLTIDKDLGRQLKGIDCSVIATGFDKEVPACFLQPFEMTANYLKMNFKGHSYFSIQDESNLDNIGGVDLERVIENICSA